jgi:hypothetical protein
MPKEEEKIDGFFPLTQLAISFLSGLNAGPLAASQRATSHNCSVHIDAIERRRIPAMTKTKAIF